MNVHSPWARRHLVVAAIAVGLFVAPSAAGADGPKAEIGSVKTEQGQLTFLVTVTGANPGDNLDLTSLRVTIDGKDVPASATLRVQPTNAPDANRVAIIAIDTSGSMQGAGLAGAQAAAEGFLAKLPADVHVGLVGFAAKAELLVAPTDDRAAVSKAVTALTAGGQTSLYDAVQLAVKAAGPFGEKHLIILTDGKDTTSVATVTDTAAELKSAGIRADIVAFKTAQSDNVALQQLLAPSGGRLLAAANSDAVMLAFQQAAQEFSPQALVTVTVPGELAGTQREVHVQLGAGASTVEAVSDIALAGAPPMLETPQAAAPSRPWSPSTSLIVALGAIFVGILALLLTALTPRRRSGERRERVMEMYRRKPAATDLPESEAQHGAVAETLLQWTDRVARRRGWDEKIAIKLDRAGWRFRPHEWLLLRGCLCFAFAAALTLAIGNVLLGVLIGAALGWFGTDAYLRFRVNKRLSAFEEQLPELLQLVTGSLQIGFSLAQALDAAAREGEEPAAGEIRRALAETRLGLPLEDALDKVADRMNSDDCRWTVMAIRIQRKVGGNLTEVLLTIVKTMRERAMLHRQVRALSAEGRLSSYILTGLPVFMTLYLLAFRRSYIRPLWTETLGIAMSVIAITLVVIGTLWMRKMARVEV